MKDSFDSIEDAIADIRAGKVVIVVDDEDRENEGDFLTAWIAADVAGRLLPRRARVVPR